MHVYVASIGRPRPRRRKVAAEEPPAVAALRRRAEGPSADRLPGRSAVTVRTSTAIARAPANCSCARVARTGRRRTHGVSYHRERYGRLWAGRPAGRPFLGGRAGGTIAPSVLSASVTVRNLAATFVRCSTDADCAACSGLDCTACVLRTARRAKRQRRRKNSCFVVERRSVCVRSYRRILAGGYGA